MAPGARAALADVAATVADSQSQRHPPIAASSHSSPPAAPGAIPAPAQPPRILKKPQPLAPTPVDVVPQRRSAVGPDDPTLIRPRVQAPPPITLPQVDPFASEPSNTRPLRDLPPTSVGNETEELPPAPSPPPPAPRPVTISAPPSTLASPPPTIALPPEELPRRPTPLASSSRTPAPAAARPSTQTRPPAESARPPTSAVMGSAAAPVLSSPSAPPPAPSAAASPAAIADPVAHERVRLQLAGTPRLALAGLIDTLLAGALGAFALVALLQARGVRADWQPVVDMLHADPVMGALTLVAGPTLVVAGYHFACVVVLSATLGQLALGLRVRARASGARPGVVRSLVRALGTAAGVLLLGAGPCWGLFVDRERRGFGDLIARSFVVRAAAPADKRDGA